MIEKLGLDHMIDKGRLPHECVIVDAGACDGNSIEIFNKVLPNNNLRIHAFECSPINLYQLYLKNYENAIIYPFALVGDNENDNVIFRDFTLIDTNPNFGKNGEPPVKFTRKGMGNIHGLYNNLKHNREYKVKTIKINKLFDTIKEERIDYLKMDIERCEIDIIDTMTIEQSERIDQISLEFHGDETEKEKSIAKLKSLNYTIQEFKNNEIYACQN